METNKKLRCPMGIPGGVIATLLGLIGIVAYTANIVPFEWVGLITSIGLFLIGAPFIRFIMMVHSANDRLDELEKLIKKQ